MLKILNMTKKTSIRNIVKSFFQNIFKTRCNKNIEHKKSIKTFVSNRARGVNKQKVDEMMQKVSPKLIKNPSDIYKLFTSGKYTQIALEIGSGYGQTAICFAKNNPSILYIACEVYIKGLENTFKNLASQKLDNLYLHSGDALDLIDSIKNYNRFKIDYLFVLYPDPWRKTKHHKRRIFKEKNLQTFSSTMLAGSQLLFATDHDDYKQWTMQVLVEHLSGGDKKFSWQASNHDHFNNPPQWWTSTKYEQKAIAEGRKPMYITLIKD